MNKKSLSTIATIMCSCVTIVSIAGCSNKHWYTPQAPVTGIKQTWQVMKVRSTKDSSNTFTLDLGVASQGKSPDYSFWLSDPAWSSASRAGLAKTLGSSTVGRLIPKAPYYYELTIPNTANIGMPGTAVAYGKGDSTALVQSVWFGETSNSTIIVFSTSQKLQWTQTSASPKNQTISFTWNKI
ncbi:MULTISPECIES: hypothetical protein [Alicyclobacillus]|uniref:Lipoprotein n=1 Tax=Alicyclobacillus acidoterrestris (strain ATCC 49025 / DSM 3922 / CIP 106132 / NCIMB 13137 / GD3B) TaxID=1356854 RepID=A0A9E6ZN91_ALIAG|nr:MULTISPECIES: hypothetical protein [Alicyclobacillus]UNO47360.1 hypothetical protein K1I37_11535 [Alicyclobacillus acidoterrestris]